MLIKYLNLFQVSSEVEKHIENMGNYAKVVSVSRNTNLLNSCIATKCNIEMFAKFV